MKKITILAMVLVLCLGAIGVGYAAWTDEIEIEGTVTTGSVDLEVVKYSGCFVYKNLETDVLVHDRVYSDTGVFVPGRNPEKFLLVAWSLATPGPEDDQVTITYWNVFPDVQFFADFQLHYAGTIPAIVDFELEIDDDWISALEAPYGICMKVHEIECGTTAVGNLLTLPIQMHFCECIRVEASLKIPQDNELQNETGSFTITFTAIQWNEYPTT